MFICGLILVIFLLGACSILNSNPENSILGEWVVDQIIYDDGSVRVLEEGSRVVFDQGRLTEIITGHGKYSYSYNRNNQRITLSVSDEEVEWYIIKQTKQALQIKTTIGLYNLSKLN